MDAMAAAGVSALPLRVVRRGLSAGGRHSLDPASMKQSRAAPQTPAPPKID
jgi:hypothetical protein